MIRLALAGLFAALTASATLAQGTLTVIAANGQAAPGGGLFNQFNSLGPAANASGQIAFSATTTGPGGSGVFKFDGTAVVALARQGTPAPGTLGNYGSLSTGPAINDGGTVAFTASFSSGVSGILSHHGTTATPLVLTGQTAPGGGTYTTLSPSSENRLRINASGQIAFVGETDDDDLSIFLTTGTTVSPIARHNAASPSGDVYNYPGYHTLNNAGQVAFYSALADGNQGLEGIYRGTTAAVASLAREGQLAPGAGLEFNGFQNRPVHINNAGQVAFFSVLTAGNGGVFRSDGTTTIPIAYTGQSAPGTGAGTFGSLFTFEPTINASGQVGFFSTVTGGTATQGVFRGDGTTTNAVALQGQTAPGTTATFAGLSFDSVRINDNGQVAFRGTLTIGGGVTTANDTGLWVGTSTGDLVLVAREGDTSILSGKALGQLPATFSITDHGIAWLATFIDTTTGTPSQAIVYHEFTPVPETGSILALASAAFAPLVWWRRGSGRSERERDNGPVR